MSRDNDSSKAYIIDPSAVRQAIRTLARHRSHEHLPGYLALLRRRSIPKYKYIGLQDIEEFYHDYLQVPDAPANRPYLQVFLSRGEGARLMNRNLQGSYAPSSIRAGKPFSNVITLNPGPDGRGDRSVEYMLVSDHVEQVLFRMLAGQKIPCVSLAAFLFRDRLLRLPDGRISNLIPAVQDFLALDLAEDGDETFNRLFLDDSDEYSDDDLIVQENGSASGSVAMVSENRVRKLSLKELDLNLTGTDGTSSSQNQSIDVSELEPDDRVLTQVQNARELGYAGVILSGPPGTGKSWYAQQIAVALAGRWDAVRSVQFHPSYQYEDFMFGFVPTEDGKFVLQEKEFARLCRAAAADPETTYVLVIDELSRTDVARVFGEAFTYLATDKREQQFRVAAGEEMAVPRNVTIIATMNSWDKGVDELDTALERRFAEIAMPPDSAALRKLLTDGKVPGDFLERLIDFFDSLADDAARVQLGHAYFLNCKDEDSATRVWNLRLGPTLKRACGFDETAYSNIETRWRKVVEGSGNAGEDT